MTYDEFHTIRNSINEVKDKVSYQTKEVCDKLEDGNLMSSIMVYSLIALGVIAITLLGVNTFLLKDIRNRLDDINDYAQSTLSESTASPQTGVQSCPQSSYGVLLPENIVP